MVFKTITKVNLQFGTIKSRQFLKRLIDISEEDPTQKSEVFKTKFVQSVLNYKFYETKLRTVGFIHASIYLAYCLTITYTQMYFPKENPGNNPYVVLAWCIYFVTEEVK